MPTAAMTSAMKSYKPSKVLYYATIGKSTKVLKVRLKQATYETMLLEIYPEDDSDFGIEIPLTLARYKFDSVNFLEKVK